MAKKEEIRYGIVFDVDKNSLKSIRQQLQELRSLKPIDILNNTGKTKTKENIQQVTKSLREVDAIARNLDDALSEAFNPKINTINIDKFKQSIGQSGKSLSEMRQSFSKLGPKGELAFAKIENKILRVGTAVKQSHALLDKMATTLSNSIKWGLSSAIINKFTSSIQQAWGFSKSLDKSLNSIRVVTGKSADEMARFAEKANTSAAKLGRTTTDYTKASLIYAQQGLKDNEIEARTETTLKVANVTGETSEQVSQELTAVWNGYKVSADQAELYIDRLAAIASNSASSLSELATGMSKVASAAATLGVGEDQLAAQLSTIISVTRQAPETVGTALKTVYARITDIKAGIQEDGTTLGQYSNKMAELGINIIDTAGNLRNMGQVMEEIGNKWNTLSKQQQIYLAQTMAGQRQYSNLIALFNNFDKYEDAMEVAGKSSGTLAEQQDIYMDSTQAHLNQLTAATEDMWKSLVDNDSMKSLIDFFTGFTKVITNVFDALGGGGNVFLTLGSIALTVFRDKINDSVLMTIRNFEKGKEQAKALSAAINEVNNSRNDTVNKMVEKRQKSESAGAEIALLTNEVNTGRQGGQQGQGRKLTDVEKAQKQARLENLSAEKEELDLSIKIDKIHQQYYERLKQIYAIRQKNNGIYTQDDIDKMTEANEKLREAALLRVAAQSTTVNSANKNLENINDVNGNKIELPTKGDNAAEEGEKGNEEKLSSSQAYLQSQGSKSKDSFANRVDQALQEQKQEYLDAAKLIENSLKEFRQAIFVDINEETEQTASNTENELKEIEQQYEDIQNKIKQKERIKNSPIALSGSAKQDAAREIEQLTKQSQVLEQRMKEINNTIAKNPSALKIQKQQLQKMKTVAEQTKKALQTKKGKSGIIDPKDIDRVTVLQEKIDQMLKNLGKKDENGNEIVSKEELAAVGNELGAVEQHLKSAGDAVNGVQQNLSNLTGGDQGLPALIEQQQKAKQGFDNSIQSITALQKVGMTATETITSVSQGVMTGIQLGNTFGEVFGNSKLTGVQKFQKIMMSLSTATMTYSKHISNLASAFSKLSKNEKNVQQNAQGASTAIQAQTGATQGASNAQKGAAVTATAWMAALGPIMAILSIAITIVTAITSAIEGANQKAEEQAKAQRAAALETANAQVETLENEKKFLKETRKVYDQFKQGLLTREELKNQIEQLGQQYEIEASQINALANAYGNLNEALQNYEKQNASNLAQGYRQQAGAMRDKLYEDDEWQGLDDLVRGFNDYYKRIQGNKDTDVYLAEYQKKIREAEERGDLNTADMLRSNDLYKATKASKVNDIYQVKKAESLEQIQTDILEQDLNQLKSEEDYVKLRQQILEKYEDDLYASEADVQKAFDKILKAHANEAYQKYNTLTSLYDAGVTNELKLDDIKDLDSGQISRIFELSPNIKNDYNEIKKIIELIKKDSPIAVFSESNIENVASRTLKIQDVIKKLKQGKTIASKDFKDLGLPEEITKNFTEGLNGFRITGDYGETIKLLQNEASKEQSQLYSGKIKRRNAIQNRLNVYKDSDKRRVIEEAKKRVDKVLAEDRFDDSIGFDFNDISILEDLITAYEITNEGQQGENVGQIEEWRKQIEQINNASTNKEKEKLFQTYFNQNQINDLKTRYGKVQDWTLEGLEEELEEVNQQIQQAGNFLQETFFLTDSDIKESDIYKIGEIIKITAKDSKLLSKNLIENSDLTVELSKNMLRFSAATKSALDNMTSWEQGLRSGSLQSIAEIKNTYQDVLNLFGDDTLSVDFLTNLNNLQLLKTVLFETGDAAEQAYEELLQAANEDILKGVDTDTLISTTGESFDTAMKLLEETAKNQKVGSIISDDLKTKYAAAMVKILSDSGKTVQQIRGFFENIHMNVKLSVDVGTGEISLIDDSDITVSANYNSKLLGVDDSLKNKLKEQERQHQKNQYKQLTKLLKQQRDIYHDINKELDEEALKLKRLQTQQKGLYGSTLIKNLNQQLQLLEAQNKSLEKKKKLQEQDLKNQRQSLMNRGASFDQNGNLSNYMSIIGEKQNDVQYWIRRERGIQQKQKTLDSSSEEYKDLEVQLAEVQFNKQLRQDELNDLKTDIQNYEKVQKDLEDVTDKISDLARQKIAINIEKVDTLVKIKLDLKDITKEWNDFKRNILEKDDIFNPDAFKSAEKDAHQILSDMTAIADVMPQSTENLMLYLSELKKFNEDENYQSKYFNNKGEALEKVKELMNTNKDLYKDFSENEDKIKQLYLNTFDNIQQVFEKRNSLFDFVRNQISHNISLLDLVGQQENYVAKERNYNQLVDMNLKSLQNLKAQKAFWEEQKEKALLEGNQALADKAEENLKTVIENIDSLLDQSLEEIKNKYENAINKIANDIQMKLTQGHGFDYLTLSWEKFQQQSNLYLDDVNSAFAIKNVKSSFQTEINNLSGLKTQQQLKKVMNEQLSILQKKDKLTQYDVDRALKLLEIEKAKIALEEAQNNKTTMRLKRNFQGNYSYQFTANEDKINQAQEQLDKLNNDLYNFDKKTSEDNMNNIVKVYADGMNEIQEIAKNNLLNEEEKTQRIKIIWENMQAKITMLLSQNVDVRKNISESAMMSLTSSIDDVNDAYRKASLYINDYISSSAQKIIDTWIEDPDSIKKTIEQGINDMKKQNESFKNEIHDACDAAGKDLNEVRTGELDPTILSMQGLNKETDGLITDVQKLVDNADSWTAELKKYTSEWKNIFDNTDNALKKAKEYVAYVTGKEYKKAVVATNKDNKNNTNNTNNTSDGPKLDQGGNIAPLPTKVSETRSDENLSEGQIKKAYFKRSNNETKSYTGLAQYEIDSNAKNPSKYSVIGSAASAFSEYAVLPEQASDIKTNFQALEIYDVLNNKNHEKTIPEEEKEKAFSALADYLTNGKFPMVQTIKNLLTNGADPGDISKSYSQKFSNSNMPIFPNVSSIASQIEGLRSFKSKKEFVDAVFSSEDRMDKIKYFYAGYDTGGYTGNWNSKQGKLAILHEKELILNKKDTENMLKMLQISREHEAYSQELETKLNKFSCLFEIQELIQEIQDMVQQNVLKTLDLQIKQLNSPQYEIEKEMNKFNELLKSTKQQLEQEVKIEANFPNVNSRKEIEEAFNDLINIATQKALNYNKN